MATVERQKASLALERLEAEKLSPKLQKSVRQAANMVDEVIQLLGYGGLWCLKVLHQAPPAGPKRIKPQRVDPDGLRMRVRPGTNETCREYILKAPDGTHPAVIEQLKNDFEDCVTPEGVVKRDRERTPEQLVTVLAARIGLEAATETVLGRRNGKAVPYDLFRSPRIAEAEERAILQKQLDKAVKPKLPPTPGPEAKVVGALLERMAKVKQFKQDLGLAGELESEKHVLAGKLQVAKEEVRKVEEQIATIHQTIAEFATKWPDHEAMIQEETDLRALAAGFRSLEEGEDAG